MTAVIARHERDEYMRRARNAQFYRDSAYTLIVSRERWADTVRVHVRNARAWNRELIRITRRWGRKRSYET